MATGLGSYTPEQIDALPFLSPGAKAAWKASLAPAPAPVAAPTVAAPPLLSSLSPGASAMYPGAPDGVQSAMTPVDPATLNNGPSVAGQGLAGQVKKALWATGASTEDTAGVSVPPDPLRIPAPPGASPQLKSLVGPPVPQAGAPIGPPSAPGGGGAVAGGFGGGGFAGPSDGPTGYGQPAPVGDPLAAKKAAVLLPGQDAQFQHEMAFGASQNAKDAELLGIKATAQEKMAAEQAGATEAYATAQAQEAKERENFAAFYDGETQKLQQTSDRLANAKVDSMRMFKQEGLAGVFQAVSVAFAMYAGVKGAAATGGQNAGVVALEKAIDRDVAMQEKDLQRQEAGLARSNSLLAQKYRVFGDMQMAKAAAKMDAWKLASMRADVIAQQSGAEAAKVGAAKMKEAADRGLSREQENWNIGIEAKYKQFQMQQAQAAAAAAGAQQAKMDEERKFWRDKNAAVLVKAADEITKGGGIPQLVPVIKVDPDTGKQYAAYTLKDAKTGKEFTEVPGGGGGPGATVTVPVLQYGADGAKGYTQGTVTKEDAKKVKEANEAYAGINDKLLELRKLRAKHGGGWVTMPGSGLLGTDAAKDRDKALALHGQIKLEVKKIAELGAPSAKDWELVEDIAGADPTAYGGTYDTKLDAMGSWASTKHKSIVEGSVKGAAPGAPIQMTPVGGQ